MQKIEKEVEGGNRIKNKLLDSMSIEDEQKYWNYSLENILSSVYQIELLYNDYKKLFETSE